MKNNKIETLVWTIFLVFGIIFIFVGTIICINEFSSYDNRIETVGIITDISSYRDMDGDTSFAVYVSYNVNGREYKSRLNSYSSSFYEGKEIEIYYDKDEPNKIRAKSLDLTFLVFPGVGLTFAMIGGAGLIVRIKRKKLEKELKENGEIVYADYVETVFNSSYSSNGRHPYNIICKWCDPTDNKIYIFKSKNIWIDPESMISEKNIQQFPVYLNKNDKRKYLIDIENLTNDIVDLT